MVVFGGLDSDDVPLSRLCTATVMVCGMGGEERGGEGGGLRLANCMHILWGPSWLSCIEGCP